MSAPAKHTPGPWARDDRGNVRSPEGERVNFRGLTILYAGHPASIAEAEANTALALAAPELLEALRTGLDLIEGPKVDAEWKRGCRDFRLAARAAIAKAEGRE